MLPLLLPRKYLSYSAMMCWITNPVRFRREYFEGGKKLDTKYLKFGKGIAKMLEDGTYKEILPELEVRGKSEYKIECVVGGIPVLSFIDAYEENIHEFDEFKSGKISWTKAKVQKHEQLPFYATVLKWHTGIMPKRCRLVWIETSEDAKDPSDFWAVAEKQLAVTGKIVTFTREFDDREIKRMEKLIIKSAREISQAYRAFIAEI